MISPVPATTVETLMPGYFFSKAATTAFTMSESAAEYTTTESSGFPCAHAVPATIARMHPIMQIPEIHPRARLISGLLSGCLPKPGLLLLQREGKSKRQGARPVPALAGPPAIHSGP